MQKSTPAESPDAYVKALAGWRGQRLKDVDDRLKPGGKYEMATITLAQGDSMSATQAKRPVKAASGLNRKLGDPTDI